MRATRSDQTQKCGSALPMSQSVGSTRSAPPCTKPVTMTTRPFHTSRWKACLSLSGAGPSAPSDDQ